VLAVQTNSLVIDSGYASLLRPELKGAWHFPGTVVASRDPHLVEDQTPGSICVGQIFLTDLPRKRRAKVKINVYDYVVIDAYPAGQYTYTLAGDFPHTVRRFSCGLETAVKLRLAAGGK
jgi:diaminopimelate decarboxylase